MHQTTTPSARADRRRRTLTLTSGLLGVAALLLLFAGCASAPPPPPPPPAAVGTWNMTIETPVGNQEATLMVSGTADALTGSMTGQGQETPISDVVFADGALSFGVSINAQGTQLDLTFEGKVDGDSLTGSFQSPFGPAPVTGTRSVQ